MGAIRRELEPDIEFTGPVLPLVVRADVPYG